MRKAQILLGFLLTGLLALIHPLGAAAQSNGPGMGQGPIVIPKQVPRPTPQPTPAPTPLPKPQEVFHVSVPEVQIPVTVETKDGNFIGNLTAANFRLYEDGVQQKIQRVRRSSDRPITVVMLVEFSDVYWPFTYQILQAAYTFTGTLQPHDWVALVTYDLKDHVTVDFTHNKRAIYSGLESLDMPSFSEDDLFDALSDTLSRLEGIHGHKIIVLLSSGQNTFSHITFGTLQKQLKATHDVTIFSVSLGWADREFLAENGGLSTIQRMDFLQGNNELRYFATITGGRYYEPRFEGSFPGVFQDIAATVRNEYILTYQPTDSKLDGTYRKVKVEVVAPDGKPLRVVNQKGKNIKYTVEYRHGYTAKFQVE